MFLTIRHKTFLLLQLFKWQSYRKYENLKVMFMCLFWYFEDCSMQLSIVLWYPLWVHVPSSRLTAFLHCFTCSNCCHHDLQGPFCRALLNFRVPVDLFLQPVSVPLMFPEVINEDAEQCWPHCQPLGYTSSDWLQMTSMPLITTLWEWQFNQFWTQPSSSSVCLWGCYGPKAC